jgi:hypothetical protein
MSAKPHSSPGINGNPSGVAKRARLSQACREVLAQPFPGDPKHHTHAEKIPRVLAEKAAASVRSS